MPRLAQLASLCSALVIAALPVSAIGQWAWRDKSQNNQITYSDVPPPPHVPESDILRRPNSRPAAPATTRTTVAPPADNKPAPVLLDPKLQAARKEAEKKAAEDKRKEDEKLAATRAANCEGAKTTLRTLESGLRMARTNAKGETEVLDDKARQAEMRRAQDVIRSECAQQ